MAIYPKKGPIEMPSEGRSIDRLGEIHELNRLFLTYIRACARQGRLCMGLSSRVAQRLVEAEPATLFSVRLEEEAHRAPLDGLAPPPH